MTRGARSFLTLGLLSGILACTSPVPDPAPAPPDLGRSARVLRAVFHDAEAADDAALGSALADRIERRLGLGGRSEGGVLELEFQFARIEVSRQPRLATLPLTVVTASLYALLGPDAWQVVSRLHGRLRIRDASGCVVAESVARLEYTGFTDFGRRGPLPDPVRVTEIVDRLVERSARRLAR